MILKGSVTFYARTADELCGDFLPTAYQEIGAVRSAQERVAYYGAELGSLKSGRSFGEMVLMGGQKERNAKVTADELTELIIVNRELFKQSFQTHDLVTPAKSAPKL